jgi:hypothetical protein
MGLTSRLSRGDEPHVFSAFKLPALSALVGENNMGGGLISGTGKREERARPVLEIRLRRLLEGLVMSAKQNPNLDVMKIDFSSLDTEAPEFWTGLLFGVTGLLVMRLALLVQETLSASAVHSVIQ